VSRFHQRRVRRQQSLSGPLSSFLAVFLQFDFDPLIGLIDLLHEKLRAASDTARRRSKRLQDFADAQALLESAPTQAQELTTEEHALGNKG